MNDWLHDLHRQNPWLPLLVCLTVAGVIMSLAALLIRLKDHK